MVRTYQTKSGSLDPYRPYLVRNLTQDEPNFFASVLDELDTPPNGEDVSDHKQDGFGSAESIMQNEDMHSGSLNSQPV